MSYPAENAVAWLLLPVLLVALCVGLGLLVTRLLRATLPPALLPPLGLCVAIVAPMPLYEAGLHGIVPPLVLAIAGAAGLALGRRDLRSAVDGPAFAAAGAVYLAYIAPVVLSGDWTWSGYNFVNDTAVQLLLVDHVDEHGANIHAYATIPGSSQPVATADVVVREYLATNYPLGIHQLLAALATLLGTEAAALYQPFLAALVGFGAMALVGLGARSGMRAWLAGAVAIVVALGNLLYQYGLQGNVKEMGFFAAWAAAAALGRELLSSRRPLATAACIGVAGAAALSAYSAAALPYLLCLAIALLVARWFVRGSEARFPLIATTAVGLGVFLVLGFVALRGVVGFSDAASDTYTGSNQDELGHLLRPLPTIQAAGVWLSGNYREAIAGDAASLVTTLASWAIVALLIAGAVHLVRRREPGPFLFFLPAAITYAVFTPRVATYADAKILVTLSPAVLFLAAFGVLSLRGRALRPAAAAIGVGVAALVGISAALAYHDVQLAPTERMKAIEDFAERLPRRETVLWNESEEFVKYFARSRTVNVAFENLTPRRVKLRRETRTFGEQFDLDDQRLEYVQTFDWIVMRRAPDASRPPAGYELAESSEYYELWHRSGSRRARVHLPLQDVNRAALTPRCSRILRFAQQARPGEHLVAAARSPAPKFDPSVDGADRPPGWPQNGLNPGTVTTAVPGVARGAVDLEAGRYDIWLRGSFGRPMQVKVDGRDVGEGKWVDGRRQWTHLSRADFGAGPHKVEIRRPGGSLAPGDGNPAYSVVGPVAFVAASREPARLREVDPREARRLCGGTYDWIEIVRP